MNPFGNLNSSFFISSNSLILGQINNNIPHIFNSQTNYIQTNEENECTENECTENECTENANKCQENNHKCEENVNKCEENVNKCEENVNKKELFELTNISSDIDNIIKHTLNANTNYNFNIEDDSITVNLGNSCGDFNVIKNIMAYLYHKQINGELNNFGNTGEFVVQSYSSMPIQTTYLFEDESSTEEKFDYFANCKLINKLVGKAEKIKKDDPLLADEESCFICFEKYKEKELKRKLPHCNHFFHKKCIDKWLKNKSTCPHCRIDLMDHITLSSEDKKEYYNKNCNCDEDDTDDAEIQYVEFNLGIIGVYPKENNQEENNQEEDENKN